MIVLIKLLLHHFTVVGSSQFHLANYLGNGIVSYAIFSFSSTSDCCFLFLYDFFTSMQKGKRIQPQQMSPRKKLESRKLTNTSILW